MCEEQIITSIKSFYLHPSNGAKYEVKLSTNEDKFLLEIKEDGHYLTNHFLYAPHFVCGLVFSPEQKSIRKSDHNIKYINDDQYAKLLTKREQLHHVTKLLGKIISMNKDPVEIKEIS